MREAPQDFVFPSQRSLRLAIAASLSAVGLEVDLAAEDAEAAAQLGIEKAPRICFVLVDGLGARNLAERSGHARTLRSWTHREPLTSVVPSTTATAITSATTAAWPGQTAMMGYSLRNPDDGQLFSLIKWEGQGLDPAAWQRVPTLFERLGEQAGQCRVVQPEVYVGSGMSLAALRGVEAIGVGARGDRIAEAARAFRQGASFVYLYWGELDRTGHARGWESEAWTAQLEELDSAMAYLARSLPAGTLIVVTADHGMVDVAERLDVAHEAALDEDVQLVAGEERAVQLYTERPEAVSERWAEILGERAWVLTRDEAVDAGLFGPDCARGAGVAGDVLAFMDARHAVADSRTRPNPSAPFQKGVHGSLTAEEMLVPLIMEVS